MTSTAHLLEPAPLPHRQAKEPLTVVGIGASAGGLKALQLFFDSVPADCGMAYVVIMHLDPERESRIAAILQDRTPVPVTQVTRSTTVEANHIYIIPPGHDLAMSGNIIRLLDRSDHPQHNPVDLFFRTLAQAHGANAVAVVLSGTGSDGTSGIRYVREAGGITAAQAPDEADYDAMPANAIATGQIDLVLPSAQIPAELIRLRRTPSPLHADPAPAGTEAQLRHVFAALRGKTGHDFSLYKRSTVLRRLDRRLGFNGVKTLEEYVPVLRASETESAALVRDLLISVSGFFRDPEAFAALGEAIPALFEGKGPEDAVRVWVAGCATGEEAYSIAILLSEHAATLAHPPQLQMFATDIDEKGYARGREALYPASAVADMPPERLRTFFTQEAGGYRVKKSLREGVLFAVHNVLHDPPFSRLDLISCRNLLIYLQPEAQDQVVETFHYALRRNGVLFLGASETAGDGGLFVPVDGKQRVYRRDAGPHQVPSRLSAADPPPPPGPPPAGPVPRQHFSYGAMHLRMLETYAPPSLIVDEQLKVVHLSRQAGRYLHLGEGEPSHSVIDLSRGDLRMELRTALGQAFEKGLPTTRRVRIDGNGGRPVSLLVHPPVEDGNGGRFALVVFDEKARPRATLDTGPQEPADPARGPAVARLEEELRRTKAQLEATSAARDRTVEALQQANEELQSINEEQKSAAEELETSREEIQSINEELTTINQEHQNTIEEQKRTNADLQNLIGSTEIGTIFLDAAMRIRSFTPAVAALFNFLPTDEGRPLADITHHLDYPGLVEDAQRVLTSLERIEREVSSETGGWFIVRISPYRAPDHAVDGAVVTFFDITAQKRVEEELREAKVVAESANLAKGNFLATLSHEFRTPLTGILGYADILELDGPLTAAQQQKVERIKAGAWHLAAMIDEILAFAMRDEGHHVVRSERMDAREIAREAKVLVEPVAEAKRLAFVLDVPDEPVELETDGAKARQILINLCGNAVKYTERGEIRLRVHAEGERVVFEVRDTGIGIASEHQPHVFERFWQVDSASTRSFGGMGIGLAAAREYSRLLGGEVEVESEPGRGSTFRVWLPRTRVDAASAPQIQGHTPAPYEANPPGNGDHQLAGSR
ncbi:MAG TPA: chemotaxis protein CheB [Longimicrobiaceae bacterium]|nr:chemotaxis protein CheB [Longimicrobiaceae bacterium]